MTKKTMLITSTILVVMAGAVLTGCKASKQSNTDTQKIVAVGAENEYADVIKQIGGKYVSVTGIMSNPETDPHSYEANTVDASAVNKATLIVQNGLGYDDFMTKLEKGASNSKRQVINVADTLGYASDTKNPHLWYHPDTMSKVAEKVASALENQMPAQKDYYENNLKKFNTSLGTWKQEIAELKTDEKGANVAVTEPVADYLVDAAELTNKTPWNYQAAVMNGVDPSPQDVKTQQNLFNEKTIKVFLYNSQAVDDSTTALLDLAKQNNIPVVGVYETMPNNYTYQKWMEAETKAIISALKDGKSTEKL